MADQPSAFPPPMPSVPQVPAVTATPWFRRRFWKLPVWGWAIILVVLVIAGATGGKKKESDDSARNEAAVLTSTSVAVTSTDAPTTTVRATTTTAAPTTTLAPTTTAPPQPVVFSGRGSDVVNLPPSNVWVATISYSGRSNFVVWSLDAGLERTDLLVNEIGRYAGRVPVNMSGDATALEIEASGDWSISLLPIESDVRRIGASTTGTGSDVLFLDDAAVFTVTHSGQSNFVVWVYGSNGTDLAVNEIGAYSGNVPLRGPAFVVISADGAWSITKS